MTLKRTKKSLCKSHRLICTGLYLIWQLAALFTATVYDGVKRVRWPGATEVNYYFCIELLFLSLAPADCSSVLNLPSLHPVFVSGS